VIYLLL